MKRKIMIVTDFPSLEKPTYYSWIKTRVEALKNIYDIAVVKIVIDARAGNQITKTEFDGYVLYEIRIKKISVPKMWFFYAEIKIKKLLSSLVDSIEPELIHVHFSSYYSWIVRQISEQFRIPYFITEHASYFEKVINRFYLGTKVKGALSGATKIYAVSRSLKEIIEKYIDRDVIVKNNIVDTERFSLNQSIAKKRDYLYMLTVGSFQMNDNKGYELLLKALGEFRKDNVPFRCDLIGDGPNRGRLEQLIEQYDLTNNVRILGTISNDLLVDYYQQSDFFISSSRIETFGVAIVEAMSCGVPVLATRSGGPEDYITDEVGILVVKECWASLYEGIKKMSTRYQSYDPHKIRWFVLDNFSKCSYIQKVTSFYDQSLRLK